MRENPGIRFHAEDRAREMITLVVVMLAVVTLAGCASGTRQAERGRIVMSEHRGWTIRITPSFSHGVNRWRARAEVWPPGILLRFNDTAWDQSAVVQSALQAARRYIDASHTEPQGMVVPGASG